jgi:uncharacterized membrane protein YcaP (DUF421 family)
MLVKIGILKTSSCRREYCSCNKLAIPLRFKNVQDVLQLDVWFL